MEVAAIHGVSNIVGFAVFFPTGESTDSAVSEAAASSAGGALQWLSVYARPSEARESYIVERTIGVVTGGVHVVSASVGHTD